MIKLVIFDLDGTLLDTIGDLAMATNYALRRCGYPEHEIPEYRFFVGNGIRKLFERALPEPNRSAGEIERLRAYFLEYYGMHKTDLTRPYPGIPGLLQGLEQKGIALAVASNKYQEATESLIRHFFPDRRFVAVLGQREGIPVKPDPAIVEEIIRKAGVRAEEVLYVGDSGVDMETASRAGIVSAGAMWGFRPESELKQYGAVYLAAVPEEIGLIAEKL